MIWIGLSLLGYVLLLITIVVVPAIRLVRYLTNRPLWEGNVGETAAAFLGCIISYFLVWIALLPFLDRQISETLVWFVFWGGVFGGAVTGAYVWYRAS